MKAAAIGFAALCALLFLGTPSQAQDLPGELNWMDMKYVAPQPAYPAHVIIEVYKNGCDNPSDLRGVSEADFDGTTVSNIVCDAIACITDITVEDGQMVVYYRANGYESGPKFAANSCFAATVNGNRSTRLMHTSCSQIVYLDTPYGADPMGAFYVVAGQGTCLRLPFDCPPDDGKLFWVVGFFRVPCAAYLPVDLTFKLFKGNSDLKGISMATYDGSNLVVNYCDPVACITDAAVNGNDLDVWFIAHGTKGQGEFENDSTFEIEVSNCGDFFVYIHTSCSQDLYTYEEYPLIPGGFMMWTDACGCVIPGQTPVTEKSWGSIKSFYR